MLKDEGIRVPVGFATPAEAYREYLRANDLPDKIRALLPEFAEFLVDAGIDCISLNPDSVVPVRKLVAEAERRR
ncbi:MAG: hypothetical protein R6V60_09750 [Desulfobacterales bacterium]